MTNEELLAKVAELKKLWAQRLQAPTVGGPSEQVVTVPCPKAKPAADAPAEDKRLKVKRMLWGYWRAMRSACRFGSSGRILIPGLPKWFRVRYLVWGRAISGLMLFGRILRKPLFCLVADVAVVYEEVDCV